MLSDDIFDMFCKLKKADGFDTQDVDGYYEAFFKEWNAMVDTMIKEAGNITSVYEVGCGSGVNLYLFQKLKKIERVGGCDYSEALLDIAKKVWRILAVSIFAGLLLSDKPVFSDKTYAGRDGV